MIDIPARTRPLLDSVDCCGGAVVVVIDVVAARVTVDGIDNGEAIGTLEPFIEGINNGVAVLLILDVKDDEEDDEGAEAEAEDEGVGEACCCCCSSARNLVVNDAHLALYNVSCLVHAANEAIARLR
jgi:hypothetical protein